MSELAWVDREQVSKVAARLKADPPETEALNFYSFPGRDGGPDIRADAMYPDMQHPQALDFFFYVVLQDYGFWYGSPKGYLEPLTGWVEGDSKKRKGSDFLWRLMKKILDGDPGFFAAREFATIKPETLSEYLSDSIGTQWPDFDNRLSLTQAWGKWLLDCDVTPELIVQRANRTERPLERFLEELASSPFGNDHMMKKAVLLAMVLYNRPEKFLRVSAEDEWPAIVDYHLMRVSLRLGIVELHRSVTVANENRSWVEKDIESTIRNATREAAEQLQAESGFTHGQIDNILWQARRYCPEMEAPNCEQCLFSSVCEQRVELFQPVIRTDAY